MYVCTKVSSRSWFTTALSPFKNVPHIGSLRSCSRRSTSDEHMGSAVFFRDSKCIRKVGLSMEEAPRPHFCVSFFNTSLLCFVSDTLQSFSASQRAIISVDEVSFSTHTHTKQSTLCKLFNKRHAYYFSPARSPVRNLLLQ